MGRDLSFGWCMMNKNKWYKLALSELGQHEVAGNQHNARIVEYHSQTGLSANDDETPWCGAFVAWCFAKSGINYDVANAASARSWLRFGVELKKPTQGCVCVFTRGSGNSGHVGFFAGEDERGNILLLGGNQSNKVSIAPQQRSRLLGYRWPKGVALPTDVKPLAKSRVILGSTAGATGGGLIAYSEIKDIREELRDTRTEVVDAKAVAKEKDYINLSISIVIIFAACFAIYARIMMAKKG